MSSGFKVSRGMRASRNMGIRFEPQMEPEQLLWLKRLPLQIQLRFQRRAIRQALSVYKRIAQPLYRRHRTNIPRKHLDESLFIVTRSYKSRSQGRNLWGALGFRVGAARGIGGVAPKKDRLYSGEWAGWRAHFLERGFTATGSLRDRKMESSAFGRILQRQVIKSKVRSGQGRWIPGKLYLPAVFGSGRFAATAVFQHSIRELLTSGGKRIGRIPQSLYAREMKELLA